MRPAAFVGWKAAVPDSYRVPGGVSDERTGKLCYYETYEALDNWHSQLLFYWVYNYPLLDAINRANDAAMWLFSDPPMLYSMLTHLIPGGEEVNFDPRTCLKVYGYGNLHFNEYNYAGQWPPP